MCVWYSYEFTLLSNILPFFAILFHVWYSYEFTLLSNDVVDAFSFLLVWYSYEFTLLSNSGGCSICWSMFDIPMNLHCSQTLYATLLAHCGLIFLWIYTALKLILHPIRTHLCLIFLWIYTALKLFTRSKLVKEVWYSYEFTLLSNMLPATCVAISVWYSYEFTLLSNMFCWNCGQKLFDIPMNLHCSQTQKIFIHHAWWFDIPMNLHCSQTYVSLFHVA